MGAPRWHDPRLLETRTLDTPMRPPQCADLAAWEERADRLRRQIIAAAGLPADWAAPRQPPRTEIFERRDHPELGYSVEKVFFESLPGCLVTGNLYRPLPRRSRGPAVLHPHGHAPFGRLQHDALFAPALRGITFARMGYCAFTYDMMGFGDSLRMPHAWGGPHSWLWGASPLGLHTWNSIRALDFLSALPDVDPERLGCTGESGGGTQTFLLTAIDSRVRVSAPVNMVSLHMQGGCACENACGLRLDTSNVEIAALAAPRPLLLVSATGDWTRDTPEREYPAVAAIYRLYGAEAALRVAHVQFTAPHNYHRGSREAVYHFFRRWLPVCSGPGDVPSEDDVLAPDAEVDLRVFARRPAPPVPEGSAAVGQVLSWYRAEAQAPLAVWPQTRGQLVAWRQLLLPPLLAVCGVDPVAPDAVDASGEGDLFWLGRRGRPERFCVRRLDPGAAPDPAACLLEDARAGGSWEVFTFATGASTPWAASGRAATVPFFLCYNRADAALRAQDLLTAVAWLGGRVGRLLASGAACAPALLARACLPGQIAELDLRMGAEWAASDPEAPWLVEGNFLPGVLRAGGAVGLLALAAPAPVRLRGTLPAGAEQVAVLYRALGAAAAWRAEPA